MKKRSVLYTWVIEFSILLILMAAMCVTLTLSARRKLLDEYTEITIQQQEEIETALNNSMSQIKTDAINLACNNVIRSFSLLSTPMPSDNYTFYTIQSLLAAPGSSRSAVSETYIYFRNLKKALTSETVYEKETLAAVLFGSGSEAGKRFDSLRTTSSLFRVVSDSSNGVTQVMAVTSIPTQGRSPTALIIQVLDMQVLGEIVAGQATMEGTTTLLMDGGGQLLCESGNPALAGQLVQMAAEKRLESHVELGNKSYYLLQKQLEEENWTLITLVPVSAITRKSNWVWQQSMVFLMVFLAVGVVAVASMVQLNYQPLRELTRSLPIKSDCAENQNEYQQIDGAFQVYRKDLERMQIFQENQRVSLQKELMQNLLEHDIEVSALSGDIASWIGIDSWGEWFVLLLLKDEGLDFSEPLTEKVTLLPVQPHGVPTLCMFAKEEIDLRQCLGLMETYLKENGVDYYAGNVRCGWKQIHPAFLSLCERSEFAQEQLERSGAPTPSFAQRITVAQGAEIARLTFAGNAEEAIRALRHTMQTNFSSPPDMFLLRMLLTDVLVAMFNAVSPGEQGTEVQ